MPAQSFKTTILTGKEKNVTGIEVPADVVASFGAGQRPRLQITVNGYSFASTVGKMGGKFMMSLSATHRAAAGVAGGDAVEVYVDLAPEPPKVTVPDDLSVALAAAGLADGFVRAAPSRRKEWVRSIEDAKAPETRAKRIQKVVDALSGS
jgi:hypothetical protein